MEGKWGNAPAEEEGVCCTEAGRRHRSGQTESPSPLGRSRDVERRGSTVSLLEETTERKKTQNGGFIQSNNQQYI